MLCPTAVSAALFCLLLARTAAAPTGVSIVVVGFALRAVRAADLGAFRAGIRGNEDAPAVGVDVNALLEAGGPVLVAEAAGATLAADALPEPAEELRDAWRPVVAAAGRDDGDEGGDEDEGDDGDEKIFQDDRNATKPPPPGGASPPPEDGGRAVAAAPNAAAEKPPPPGGAVRGVSVVEGARIATMLQTTTASQSCGVSNQNYLGDGYCDKHGGYNTPECNFDDGDCCQEMCWAGQDYTCGVNGYDCKPAGYCDPVKERFVVYYRCGGGGGFANIQFSYKRDDAWRGHIYWGDNYCNNWWNIVSPWESKTLEYTSHIQAFRMAMHYGQDAPLNLDMVQLKKQTHQCSGFCPGVLGALITEEVINSYGSPGGNGYCLNGVDSVPFDNCGNNRSFKCLEFRPDGNVSPC